MAQTRLPESDEALFNFIACSQRYLREKDSYLDALVASEEGKAFVEHTLVKTRDSINKYEKVRLMSIWAQDERSNEVMKLKLHVCKYVLHHLQAALDKLNPTTESIYFYLLNSERDDKDKLAYIEAIKKTKDGQYTLSIVKSFAERRLRNMTSLFKDNATLYEPDGLDNYPATKLSAKDVIALLPACNPEQKSKRRDRVRFKR